MKNTIITVVVLVILGLGGYFYIKQSPTPILEPKPVATTPPADNSFTTKPAPVVDETANWKTYKNDEYRFEFKYPEKLRLITRIGNINNLSCVFNGEGFYPTNNDGDLPQPLYFCVTRSVPKSLGATSAILLNLKPGQGFVIFSSDFGSDSEELKLAVDSFKAI